MIVDQIRMNIKPGTIIPKPKTNAHTVKGWGKRRDQDALIYRMPNHNNPSKPGEKGITSLEFSAAYDQLIKTGSFTHKWFENTLKECKKEGPCNFTTIGGIFKLLGKAEYKKQGTYVRISDGERNP
jgi:hypothetical protein